MAQPHASSTLRLGRLAGVPIGVQPAWVLIVGLITWSLGHEYFPSQAPDLSPTAAYGLGLLSALGLFAGILLHELGHAVVARRRGLVVDEIDLWLLGGVARMHGEPQAPQDELRFALAGPGVTVVLLAGFAAVRAATVDVAPDWFVALVEYQLFVSAAILALNLLPAFPLDGGRVVRSLLWWRTGDHRQATRAAATTGRVFGFTLAAFGLLAFAGGGGVGGLWIMLIGGFVVAAATGEERSDQARDALRGLLVADLMAIRPITVDAGMTVAEAIDERFGRYLYSAFPVVDASARAVGLVALRDVRAVSGDRRAQTSVAEVMSVGSELFVDPATPVTELIVSEPFNRHGRAVAVDAQGHAVGLLSITDVQRRIRVADVQSAPQGSPRETRSLGRVVR